MGHDHAHVPRLHSARDAVRGARAARAPPHAPTQPTPCEQVVFLDGSPVLSEGPDALFIINRIVDFAFKIDIFLTFNMSYQAPTATR